MPFTSLAISDFDLIEKIISFKIGDLWVRRYDLKDSTLTSDE